MGTQKKKKDSFCQEIGQTFIFLKFNKKQVGLSCTKLSEVWIPWAESNYSVVYAYLWTGNVWMLNLFSTDVEMLH